MLTTTSTLILEALREPSNEAAWREFDNRYRPVLEAFALKVGLSADDAADVVQATLVAFVEEYRSGHYDRDRGRLRSWLFAMTRGRALSALRQRGRRAEWRGESALQQLGDDAALEELWDHEWRQALLRHGLDELRAGTRSDPKTIRAFELLCLEGRGADEVATELQMSATSVYNAKHRTLERLRAILADLEERF